MAEKQGFQKGDIILTIDEKSFPDIAKLKKHLHFKDWDDQIVFKILREDKEIEIKFKIEPVDKK